MTDQQFNIFSTIGIFLTFLTALASVIVSIITLNDSSKAAKRSDYISSITTGRDKWSYSLRENASLYFTQIARMCKGQEENREAIYNELTRYHFSILLLLSPSHQLDVEIHNHMSAIRSKALQIVKLHKKIRDKSDKSNELKKTIQELKDSILNDHQENVYDGICFLIEREWNRQKYEATEMWQKTSQRADRMILWSDLFCVIVSALIGLILIASLFLPLPLPNFLLPLIGIYQFMVAIIVILNYCYFRRIGGDRNQN